MEKILIACFVVLISCQLSWANKYPYSSIQLPIYSKSQNVKEVLNDKKLIKTVYSEVIMACPAEQVIAYYDKEIKKLGFYPYKEDGHGLRRWEIFNNRSGRWEENNKTPGRYIATWVDPAKQLRIVLSMRYQYDYKNPKWESLLIINLSIQPFFQFPNLGRPIREDP